MFGGEALEPQRLRSWLENHPGLTAFDQHVWDHGNDWCMLRSGRSCAA